MKKYLFILLIIFNCLNATTVLFNDTFDNNNNNWEAFSDQISSTGLSRYSDYYIENRVSKISMITKNVNLKPNDKFDISLKTKYNYGRFDNNFYGLILKSSNNIEYFFGISHKNKFVFFKYVNGTKKVIVPPKRFHSLNQNILEIKKDDSTIYFIINGKIYAKNRSEKFPIISIGFFVENKQKISFDNFKVLKYDTNIMTFKNYARLTIRVAKDTNIKILNIKDKYRDDMLLKKGKYHIIATKKGFNKYDKLITLNKDKIINIRLTKFIPISPMDFDITSNEKIDTNNNLLNQQISWGAYTRNNINFKNIYFTESLIVDKDYQVRNLNYEGTDAYINFNQYAARQSCKHKKNYEKGITFTNFRLPNIQEAKSIYQNYKTEKRLGKLEYIYTDNKTTDSYYIKKKKPVIIIGLSHGVTKHIGLKRSMFNSRKIGAVCVSKTVRYSLYTIANKLYKDDLEKKSKLILPQKPKRTNYEKLLKDEFETTDQYKKRLLVSKKEIDLLNRKNFEKWKQNVTYRKKKHKIKIQQLKNSKTKDFSHFVEKAQYIKYGNPKIKKVKYNADKQFFSMQIISTRGIYNKTVKIPVKIKYAKKFKSILIDTSFIPTVLFNVKNQKLYFKTIKEVQDPEKLVEEKEFNSAYIVSNKNESIKKLEIFSNEYPESIYTLRAKKRIIALEKEIRIMKERRAKAEAEQLKRDAIATKKAAERKQRKINSFYRKKHIGEKVCMDGRVAFILSTTITAYVENINGNNIQLRIADTEGTTPNIKGVTLYRNTLIWDDYTNWYKCDY